MDVDLIYMDEACKEIGTLKKCKLDLAYGVDENDFELTVNININNNVCAKGYTIYIPNTEYGGIIDGVKVKTATKELTYIGKTWHGILATKILRPDSGADYLTVSGDANIILGTLISRLELSDLFTASSESAGVTIKNYQFNRYVDAYAGIKKMLASVGYKLKMTVQADGKTRKIMLSAVSVVDYSKNEEWDSSQVAFEVQKSYKPVNHVICLGKGDLKDRTVIDLYADSSGAVSQAQTFKGLDEVSQVYDNSNAANNDELIKGGTDILTKAWNADVLNIDFNSTSEYDVGDIVGAVEYVTGLTATRVINKKIVTIDKNEIKITHKVGNLTL